MKVSEKTKSFIENYVYPEIGIKEVTHDNVKELIHYIEENFEKPLSMELAEGGNIDYDFFLSLNHILNDLSLNSRK